MSNAVNIRQYFVRLLIFIVVIILARVFILELFAISGSSMSLALSSGDKLIISKVHYGAVMPRSPYEIPIVNIPFHIFRSAQDQVAWSATRVPGFSKISRNDIVVFEKNYEHFVKRCVGLPGETIELMNGTVYLDGTAYPPPKTVNWRYGIKPHNLADVRRALDSLNIGFEGPWANEDIVWAHLNEVQYLNVVKLREIDSIRLHVSKGRSAWGGATSKWTVDNFGRVVIPKKGMSIPLDSAHFALYSKTINEYEGATLVERNGGYFLNGKQKSTYEFIHNYYFLLGDNRSGSIDSRGIGFIPEKSIVGRAILILFSYDHEGLKWSRILKLVQ